MVMDPLPHPLAMQWISYFSALSFEILCLWVGYFVNPQIMVLLISISKKGKHMLRILPILVRMNRWPFPDI